MIISYRVAIGDKTTRRDTIGRRLPKEGRRSFISCLGRPGRFLLISLILMLLFVTTGCRGTLSLATVPSEGEAIEILNVLHENGIDAHKEEVGEEGVKQWRILLDPSWFGGSNEVAMANQILQDNGLPRPTDTDDHAASESGVFKDEATRKAEQLKEREADLQRKLRLLPGVIGVQVSIVEPEDSAININPYPSTASVLIVSKDEQPNFSPDTVRGLVARSVPKLSPESVYVAITTKPVRPLPWREISMQRRHKSLDAIGIGIMIILASSAVVLLLQMKRQSSELSSLRDASAAEFSHATADVNQGLYRDEPPPDAAHANDETKTLKQGPNVPVLESTATRALESTDI